MKILISNENKNAHYYIRMGFARAFSAAGHEVVMWDITHKNAFDAFDTLEPDLFWGQTYNLDESTIKCIAERPHMKVILRAPDHSDFSDNVAKEFPILTAHDKDLSMLDQLRSKTGKPHLLQCHYTQSSIEKTHQRYIDDDYHVVSMLNAADTFAFGNGQMKEEYQSDIAFVGGRWGYKAVNLDPYIVSLCQDFKYNIKIFGNQPWGVPQYCGFAPDAEIPHIFASAKICPSISEPHSTKYGYDIIERPFKLLYAGAFVISDYVEDLRNLMPGGIIYAKSPTDFKEKIDEYLQRPHERKEIATRGREYILKDHTYLHRIKSLFTHLELEDEIPKVDECLSKLC